MEFQQRFATEEACREYLFAPHTSLSPRIILDLVSSSFSVSSDVTFPPPRADTYRIIKH